MAGKWAYMLIEGNGYEVRQRGKQRCQDLFGRSTTVHNLLFCAHTLCMNYSNNTLPGGKLGNFYVINVFACKRLLCDNKS